MRLKHLLLTLSTICLFAMLVAAQQPRTGKIAPTLQADHPIYSKLPLTFEANLGQTNDQVSFLSRGKGYTAFLTSGDMILNLRSSDGVKKELPKSSQSIHSTVQFRLLGSNQDPQAVGEEKQPGVVNYFMGNNPARWQRHVPIYARVRYKNVYPGIDLIYYGSHQQLEYDFAVSPGADARQIQFAIQGADEVQVDGQGNLVLTTKCGILHFQSPIVYTMSVGGRTSIEGRYVMKDATHIGFQIANYDATQPLVIDPVLIYSTYLGGSGSDQLTGIAIDTRENVYVTGYSDSLDFPLASRNGLPANANHVFIAKVDPTGTNLVYADYIGGDSNDYAIGLALDNTDSVYVTGATTSDNFPTVQPYQANLPGPYSGFLTKISSDGSSLLYSTYLGGATFDEPTGIAIDNLGEAYVAGYTMSQNFPVFNAYQATVAPNQGGLYGVYGFLTKFTADGSSLAYSTYLAGNSNVVQDCGSPCWPMPYNTVNAVAVDANGGAYVTGSTNTYNFPATPGAYLSSNTTQQDPDVGFLSKFSVSGALDYSTYFYGSGGGFVGPNTIALDSSGSAYLAGVAISDGTFPVTTTSICDPGVYGFGCSYAFVTKFDSSGASLVYSTFLSPNNYASPFALALDTSNNAFVASATSSAAVSTINPIESYTSGNDILLVEIDSAAVSELFATYLGGTGDDEPAGLAIAASGNLYVAGSTSSLDFPATQGAFQSVSGGATDSFIAKIGMATAPGSSLSPNVLQFGSFAIGASSPPQTVVLRNMGSSPLSISSITTSGDFAETNNCGNGISAGGSCAFSVTFTPSRAGARSGSIVIADDATGSPHSITLNGTGAGAGAVLTPSSLTFPSTQIGASSSSQTITLTNNGSAELNISSIQITGDYAQTNNCPAVLSYVGSCTVNIQFTPTAAGTRNGILTVNDDAQPNPQTVALSGNGTTVSVTLNPMNLIFPSVPVSSPSAVQVATLTNNGSGPVNVSGINITGDYSELNNCPSTLTNGASCSVTIQFTPTGTGVRSGMLSISDNAAGAPQTVSVSGTGVDFSLTPTPGQNTIKAGSIATFELSVFSTGGSFSSPVNLSCTGLPAESTCTFSPAAVVPSTSGPASILNISTTTSTAQALEPRSSHQPVAAVLIQIQGLGLFGIFIASSGKRQKRWFAYLLLMLVLAGTVLMSGCAGGTGIASSGGSGKTSVSYTITISGKCGNLQHSVPVTLVVQ